MITLLGKLVLIFRALAHDDRGVAMALVAVSAVVLLGFTALGVETGLWYTIKRYNQSAADFGAISGAYELAAGKGYLISGPPSQGICGLAQRDAARNGFTFAAGWSCPANSPNSQSSCTNLASGNACVDNPPLFGADAGDSSAVEVILAQQQNTFFGKLFLPNVKIDVRAVAKINVNGVACDQSLSTSASPAVKFNGTADVCLGTASPSGGCSPGCGISSNSSAQTSMDFTGNVTFDAAWAQTVGNYKAGANTTIPTVRVDAPPVTDPYSCNPPQIGCAGHINYVIPTTITYQPFPASGGTLQPGWYSSAGNKAPLNFTGSNTWNLCPGIYYLDGEASSGSSFNVGAGATVQLAATGCGPGSTGNGVTIISTCSSPSTCQKGGGFSIASGAVVKLSAPTTSSPSGCTTSTPYPTPCIPSGVLFYQDPAHADTGNSSATDITANSNSFLTGTIYAPKQLVKFNGNANSTCTIVIGLTIQFSGTTTMNASQSGCTADGVTAPEFINIVLAE